MKNYLSIVLVLMLAACETAPPTSASRQQLWAQFGNKPIDDLFLAWGPPMSETHLTNGSRLAGYSYSFYSDAGSYNQVAYTCKASFLAPAPAFKITNVSLDGPDYECAELAAGHTGTAGYAAAPPLMFFGMGYYRGF